MDEADGSLHLGFIHADQQRGLAAVKEAARGSNAGDLELGGGQGARDGIGEMVLDDQDEHLHGCDSLAGGARSARSARREAQTRSLRQPGPEWGPAWAWARPRRA